MTHNDLNPALFVTERKHHERLGRRGIQRIFSELGKRAGTTQIYAELDTQVIKMSHTKHVV